MRLEKASLNPPEGLNKFLTDLGDGENGFSGTAIHKGDISLDELKKIGEPEALITVYPRNNASIRIVESNGGIYSDTVFDSRTE